MKKLILKFEKPPVDEVCLKRLEEDASYDMINKEEFKEDIYWDNIFEQFFDILSSDVNFDYIHCDDYYESLDEFEDKEYYKRLFKEKDDKEKKEFFTGNINHNFKSLYLKCSKESKNKLNKIILKKN